MNRERSASTSKQAGALGRLRERDRRPGEALRLRDEEGPQHDAAEARLLQLGDDVGDAVLAGVQVEHQLPLGEAGDAGEERRAVVRVVDRTEDGRRRHGRAGHEDVQVSDPHRGPIAQSAPRRVDHGRLGVDARVPQAARKQVLAEAAVAACEVEHLVTRPERGAERRDQLGAVLEVRPRVRVLGVRPRRRLARVLVVLRRHSRASVSGCLRTKRAMPRGARASGVEEALVDHAAPSRA